MSSAALGSTSSSCEPSWNDILDGDILAAQDVAEFCAGFTLRSFLEADERSRLWVLGHSLKKENNQTILEAVEAFEADPGSPLKRRRLERDCPPPSLFGKLKSQDQGVRSELYCHRPGHGLHVSLQVETFGKFLDNLKQENIPETMFIEGAIKLMKAAISFDSEEEKTRHFILTLRGLFQDFDVGAKPWGNRVGKSDISVCGEKGRVLVNFEIKKELGFGGDANMENIGCYVHFQKERKGERAPVFLVSVAGPHYMQVFGAAWNYESLCVDPLSKPLSLLYVPHDPLNSINELARVLEALSALAGDLLKTDDLPLKRGPYYTGARLSMKLNSMKSYCNVFEATLEDKQAIVKFASSYGKEVHDYLHKEHLAPEIYYYHQLRGGWFVIIMEYIGTPLPKQLSENLKASLKNVLDKLNEKGFVHGDLRPPNIRVVNDTVRVLDFDWAGRKGSVKYPAGLNTTITFYHSGVKGQSLILPEHDEYSIEQILSQ